MVEDDAPAALDRNSVSLNPRLITQPRADVADHHVIGGDDQGLVAQGDAVTGGGLAGEGDPAVADGEGRDEADGAADIEDDDPGARGLDRRAQAAGAGVGEGGDSQDLPAAPAEGRGPGPLGTAEGGGGSRGGGRGGKLCCCGHGREQNADGSARPQCRRGCKIAVHRVRLALIPVSGRIPCLHDTGVNRDKRNTAPQRNL